MSDFIKTAGGKLVLGAVGLAISLAWFSWKGGGSDHDTEKFMPRQVFGGGGGNIKLKYEVNQPANLVATFEQWDEQGEDSVGLNVDQDIDPGSHSQSVEIPEDTYVYFELQIHEPSPGARIDWEVFYDDRRVYSEDLELDEPLESGYAFFVQFEADSAADIRDWAGR